MQIIRNLEPVPSLKRPIALTIGNFDGVHLGHLVVLKQLKQKTAPHQSHAVVISFENHPVEVLKPGTSIPRLCSLEHKIKLLEHSGTDLLVLLTFTQEFSQQTAEEFLQKVQNYIPFEYLVLGHDATLGKDRHGDRKRIHELAKKFHFEVEYLDEQSKKGVIISSSKIRELIQKGHLTSAEELLGRKYSIYGTVNSGRGMGKTIGFPTLNVDVSGLCLPPLGVYAVQLKHDAVTLNGVANLGKAPTVRQGNEVILEVHLFEFSEKIVNGSLVEVIFHDYIRPEKRFENVASLQEQISKDIKTAQNYFK